MICYDILSLLKIADQNEWNFKLIFDREAKNYLIIIITVWIKTFKLYI